MIFTPAWPTCSCCVKWRKETAQICQALRISQNNLWVMLHPRAWRSASVWG